MYRQGRKLAMLTYHKFLQKLQVILRAAGLNKERYAGHSFRRGVATFAMRCGDLFWKLKQKTRIPEKTRATIKALKATTDRSLDAIAEGCWVSTASIHRIVTTRDKAPENRRYLSGRRRKLTPEHEASIVRSISKLREREGSFSSRRLMEQTGIRHVSYRTVRRFLNRNGYCFLQTGKNALMSQTDK